MARTASPNQMKYLKALAERTGTSFTMTPGMTMAQASVEIQRMRELAGIETPQPGNDQVTDPAAAQPAAAAAAAAEVDPLEAPHNELLALMEEQRRDSMESEGRRYEPAERYGTGKFDDAKGYGAQASYRGPDRDPAEAPQLTDNQERAIIDLQDVTGDQEVQSTVVEAGEYLDRANAREEKAASERQLKYLHALEKKLGLDESHPASSVAASRRIERYNEQLELRKPITLEQAADLSVMQLGKRAAVTHDTQSGVSIATLELVDGTRLQGRGVSAGGGVLKKVAGDVAAFTDLRDQVQGLAAERSGDVDEDLAATLALAGAASPHSIEEVAAASAAESSTASNVHRSATAHQDLGERAPVGR